MDIKNLEQIMTLLKQNDVTDFELELDGTKIKLSRGARVVTQAAAQVRGAELEPAILEAQMAAVGHTASTVAGKSNFVPIESPIVGTFYRKPSPDADVFVREGDVVKKGDTLCIIEAMKLMNEIEATMDGRIEKCLLTDGQVVEFGETLFLINPSA